MCGTAIRSMTWNAAHNGLRSVGFCGQVVILTEIPMSFRGRSEVVWEPRKLAK